MTPDEASKNISATLARLGVAETALGSVGATVARRAPSNVPNVPLPALAIDDASGELRARGELGRGGMGIVHLAEQRSLARLVAVKTTRSDDDVDRRALLHEARTMGGLEHPNVVPVHALGADGHGRPVLVMKRIEGVSWRALLEAPDHEAWAPLLAGHGDRMRANVEVLSAVARALAFAHDRGVVHRDLKPDNVMIGRFGEVYLVDWGLALRLDERDTEPDAIVGTPGYLAPEMARRRTRDIDARTDVYLLGATLFEILSGQMPHAAATPLGALAAALLGETPPLAADAPTDLADLVARALALDPATRPPSAEAFRGELTRHLASHEADILVHAADAATDRAITLARSEGAGSAGALRWLMEARFGLRSALAIRPQDVAIQRRVEACTRRLVEREIAVRNPAGARELLGELADPAPIDLVATIEACERALDRERQSLEAARAERAAADISRATPAISAITLALVLGLAGTLFVTDVPITTPRAATLVAAVVALVIGVGVVLGRKRILATPGSRRVAAFMALWGVAQGPLAAVEWARGAAEFPQSLGLVAGALVATAGAVTVLPQIWPSVPLHAIAIACCLLWPEQGMRIGGLLVVLNMLLIVRALRQRGRELGADAARVDP